MNGKSRQQHIRYSWWHQIKYKNVYTAWGLHLTTTSSNKLCIHPEVRLAILKFAMQTCLVKSNTTSRPAAPTSLLCSDTVLVVLGVTQGCISPSVVWGTSLLRQEPPSAPCATVILHSRGPRSQRWAIKVQVRLITENCSTCCRSLDGWEGFDAPSDDFCVTRPHDLHGCSATNLHTTPTSANHSLKQLEIKARSTASQTFTSLLLALMHVRVIVHMRCTNPNFLNIKS